MFPHSEVPAGETRSPFLTEKRPNSLLHRSMLSEPAGKPKNIFAGIFPCGPHFRVRVAATGRRSAARYEDRPDTPSPSTYLRVCDV